MPQADEPRGLRKKSFSMFFGGGEIWFDDVLIQKDGLYVPEELQALNPALLKKEIAL